jgi:predicted porin
MADGVTIYGAFDVGVLVRGSQKGASGASTQIASGMNGLNGIGFKMSEDLGNGLSISGDAFFQFALDGHNDLGNDSLTPDGYRSGVGGLSATYSYLALAGDFGTVLAGRTGGVRAAFLKSYDPFGGYGVGNMLQIHAGGEDYADNVIAYVTPEVLPGLKLLAAYTSNLVGQDGPSTTAPRAPGSTPLYAFAALYGQGPVSVSAAYENLTLYGAGAHLDVVTGAGSYDFGVAKVMALYQYIESAQHGWQVGATAPVGAATLKASYVHNTNSGLGACAKVAAGVNYDLSKRTRLYADLAKQTDEQGCVYAIGSNGGTFSSAAGTALENGLNAPTKSWAGDVGIRHSF